MRNRREGAKVTAAVLAGFSIFLLARFCAAAQSPAYPRKLALDGVWSYRPIARTTLKADGSIVSDTSHLPGQGMMRVPSNWHLEGLPNFNGRVRFERDFDLPGALSETDRAFLVFRGVDYFADVELNGASVGQHEGYFQAFEFDVTRAVKRGRNHVVVTADAPLEEVGAVWPDHKRLIKGVFSHWDCKPGSVSKEFGQDGTSAGIWNSVELDIRRTAWLGNVKIQSFLYRRALATGRDADAGLDAKVLISAEVHSVRPGKYSITAKAGGTSASSTLHLASAEDTAVLVLSMERPRLWWTWDLGEPFLYNCHLTLAAGTELLDARDISFGVRSIALNEKTGEWRLNDVRFFVRGTNIVPALWLSRYTSRRIKEDVKLLRAAHVNGVRVCVHVNREELYQALDRAGILAWQDFPLQWDYTHTDVLLEEAARQLRDMIRQFYNHPSVVTWVCQNESTAYNVKVMDPFLARVAEQEDSSRPVRPVAAFDEHLYAGWYEGDYHDYLRLPGGPIISEFGAQALPSLEEMREMVGSEWPPDWRKLAYHDFQYDQTFHVARVSMGQSWAEFVANSQRYQAEALKFAVEHYRRAKYQKVGSLFQFQFVDCWPSVTWSVVSYDRKPKQGYYALQRAYQEVLIGADLDRRVFGGRGNRTDEPPTVRVRPWVVNDTHRTIDHATYELWLQGRAGKVLVGTGAATVPLEADSVTDLAPVECQTPKDLAPGEYGLILILKDASLTLSENDYPITVAD